MSQQSNNMKIAFIVGTFPKASETFIIDQVCDLIDRGIDVKIISFQQGEEEKNKISERYSKYELGKITHYINFWQKLLPILLRRYLNDDKYDIYHCHFGNVAVEFEKIYRSLNLRGKIITSLYGRDVSAWIKEKGINIYKNLIEKCSLFFVMSEDMKQRVIADGFPALKVAVHPIGIDVNNYSMNDHQTPHNQTEIISVGRFVEKKGFDDLLKALSIVKEKNKNFVCQIIGDGPLNNELRSLANSLGLLDQVKFLGLMSIDKILNMFMEVDFFVQPSKTAKNGDME